MKKLKVKRVAILCVQKKSIYSQFSRLTYNSHLIDVDLYDKKRDSTTYAANYPVIAHPPCRLWGKLKHFVEIQPLLRIKEIELGIFCAKKVIENGGILEHPFDSKLFKVMGLPAGGMENELGYTLEIPQRMFGHEMIKNTWFFFSRINYNEIEPIVPAIHCKPLKSIQNLSHRQREATPAALAEWLIRQVSKVKQPLDR